VLELEVAYERGVGLKQSLGFLVAGSELLVQGLLFLRVPLLEHHLLLKQIVCLLFMCELHSF